MNTQEALANQIFKIEIVCDLATFKFENHFNSNTDFYQALCLFEANNYNLLGGSYYRVFEANGEVTDIKGINQSAILASLFDEELSQSLNKFYQDQY